jgi:hypothetical protein
MAAPTYNINVDQGSDFGATFTLKESGSPVDLTGYSARGQIRKKKTSSTITATFTCTVPDPLNGTIIVSLPNSITKDIVEGTYFYDIEIYTVGNAYVKRIIEGVVNVKGEVTR